MTPPSLPTLLVSHWQLSWSLTGETAITAIGYLWVTRRVRRGWLLRRSASFLAGLGCLLVALESGLDAYDDRLLSVHMVQHMVLLEVVPVLLLGGQPLLLVLRVLPSSERRTLAAALNRLRPYAHPVVCLFVFSAVVAATHLPAFYDATLRHPLLHDGEHAAYLLVGLLLWWPIMGADPAPGRRMNGFVQLGYVIAAMLPMEAIGAYLNRQPTLVYPAYALPSHDLGISAVLDQQHAGAIMWVAGGVVFAVVGLWCAVRALVAEERRQQIRDRRAGLAVEAIRGAARLP